jgi:RecB family endonuclease NucS
LFQNGKEFNTDIGRIDILAIDRDANLLVIELKAGKAKDGALGQLLGYMSFISSHIAKEKRVRGYIIANDFDNRLKYAVKSLDNVKLKAYKVNFSFEDVD